MGRTALVAAAVMLTAVIVPAGTISPATAATAVPATGEPAATTATTTATATGGSAVDTPLQSAWQSVLAEPRIQHALIGAYAYDVTTGQTLASIHADWRLTPGSVTKLYSTAASLADWGNRFALVTRVTQAQAGGPVYLVGGGDVFPAPFTQASGNAGLQSMARAVAAKVHGASRVVGVSTLFNGWTAGPAWDVSEVGVMGDPSVSALTSDRDDVQVTVAPGAGTGSRPVVAVAPGDPAMAPPGFFRVENDAVTGQAGTPDTVFIRCLPGTGTIVISGSKPLGSHTAGTYLAIGNPSLFTAALFQYYLAQDGVKLTQPATTGTLPGGTHEVYAYRWPHSLSSYIRQQNSWSVNQMAEDLYRLLGVATHGTGSPQAAQAAISAYLAKAYLPQDRVQVDGSGLSVLDEMSASQLVELLSYVAY
jgi:D-alanyl-D-alanine carboxypeptidase/D-alanyl-D-alanine-endopeptidase (penicillin-binding protein 4)